MNTYTIQLLSIGISSVYNPNFLVWCVFGYVNSFLIRLWNLCSSELKIGITIRKCQHGIALIRSEVQPRWQYFSAKVEYLTRLSFYIKMQLLSQQTQRERERGDDDLDESMTLAVINFQNGSHVAATITIIRCTKYGDHLLFLIVQKRKLSKLYQSSS